MAKWKDSYEKDRQKAASSNRLFQVLRLPVLVDGNGQPRAEDAKVARIRFLTDIDDAESIWVHGVMQQSRLGKKYRTDVYCVSQDGEACEFCSPENMSKDSYKSSRKILFWVYCYEILHLNADADKKWQPTEYLGSKYFIEPINAVRLLYVGPGFNNGTENKFLNWGKRFKTLTDRDYDWQREGFGMKDTAYDLIPRDTNPTEMIEEVKKIKAELPGLDKVIETLKPHKADKEGVKTEGTGTATPPAEGKGKKAAPPVDKDLEKLFEDEDTPF